MSDVEQPEILKTILDGIGKFKEMLTKSGSNEQEKATLSEMIHKNLESLKEVAQLAATAVKAQAAQWTAHELQIDKIIKTLEALDVRLKILEKSSAARKSKQAPKKRKAPKRKK
jgi:DNA-binding protein H-NS